MSGYMMAVGECFTCARIFAFNPSTPPEVCSERWPICEPCIQRINRLRAERGQVPFPIAADAYEPAEA